MIEPERSYPEPGHQPGSWGPVEVLPAFKCTGLFRSWPVDPALDAAIHDSWLAVTWFQRDLDVPVAQFVAAAIAGLDWESLAEDSER